MTQLDSGPTQADSAPTELRRNTRVRLQSSGRIVLMDYSEARSILVQDLSVDGACLKVGDWADLPNCFHLLLRRSPSEPHFQVDCTVRWRAGVAVGVEFDRAMAGYILAELIRQPQFRH
jgi:PilZ domain-containing protein